ncbi:hypothetical protein [uncultured Cohaesibacter sp.]|uniref:hypothetical protein n=1 Tax=uncultured Cohaesibacter sp. TaxID=1002546 RepID=UPI0029C95A82|nr:hypothetical protein [uncultured Cohaesibacter sp.]
MSLSRLIARIFMVPIGLFFALLARNLFISISFYSYETPIANNDIMAWWVGSIGIVFSMYLFQIWGPCLFVLIFCELFSWRSIWIYLGLGLVFSLSFMTINPQDNLDSVFNLLAIASGFVGGFVYWLIAGRSAGIVKRTLDNKPKPL